MKRIPVLLGLIFLVSTTWGQLSITSFRVKRTLPADVSTWSVDPLSVLLTAVKIPGQNSSQVKLVLQIKNNGKVICGYQPREVKTQDSSFALKAFTGVDLPGLLPRCNTLSPGNYQLCAQFYNADNESISKESCKDFTVGSGQPKEETSQTPTSYILRLTAPFNETIITETDSKYPVKFGWQLTPELNKNQDITYRLRVHECSGTQTAQQAISTNPPEINKLSKRLNLISELLPAGAAGKKYAWTVEGTVTGATGQKEIVVYTDTWTFRVAKSGKEPGPKDSGPVKNKYTGPKLKYPNNGAELKAGAINNLQLSWIPVSPTPQQRLTYRWFVYEMQGGRSATDIVKNSNPVKQGFVTNAFFATLNLPADAPGKSYAWTVQAVNDEGSSYGENDGFADPFVFTVQGRKVTGSKDTLPSSQRSLCAKVTRDVITCKGKNAQGNYVYSVKLKYTNTSNDGNKNYLNNYVINPLNGTRIPAPSNGNYIQAWPVGSATINYITPDPVLSTSINSGSSISLEFELTLTGSLSYLRVLGSHYDSDNMGGDNCDDDIIITWPPCPCDFCEILQWNESPPKSELGPDKNTAKLTQTFNIPGSRIKQVKADIVSFDWTANEDCKKCLKETYGYFIEGVATGEQVPNKESTLPTVNGIPLLFSNELQWNSCGPVSPQPLNGTFLMNVALPPQTSLNCCLDQFRICIRYTIVTDDCKTCTKAICYNLTRNQGGEIITNIRDGKK